MARQAIFKNKNRMKIIKADEIKILKCYACDGTGLVRENYLNLSYIHYDSTPITCNICDGAGYYFIKTNQNESGKQFKNGAINYEGIKC